ncbi:MAG: DNA gyrase inhibitor YacG [Burkholderiaceae bacterium]|nr:DNA gyrase inhibitor YacG [Burkholderiaceae bacterium]
MSVPELPQRIVRCPGCGGDSVYAVSNLHRPFCSARCKNSDFGTWASEGYRVASGPTPEESDEGSAPPPH